MATSEHDYRRSPHSPPPGSASANLAVWILVGLFALFAFIAAMVPETSSILRDLDSRVAKTEPAPRPHAP